MSPSVPPTITDQIIEQSIEHSTEDQFYRDDEELFVDEQLTAVHPTLDDRVHDPDRTRAFIDDRVEQRLLSPEVADWVKDALSGLADVATPAQRQALAAVEYASRNPSPDETEQDLANEVQVLYGIETTPTPADHANTRAGWEREPGARFGTFEDPKGGAEFDPDLGIYVFSSKRL